MLVRKTSYLLVLLHLATCVTNGCSRAQESAKPEKTFVPTGDYQEHWFPDAPGSFWVYGKPLHGRPLSYALLTYMIVPEKLFPSFLGIIASAQADTIALLSEHLNEMVVSSDNDDRHLIVQFATIIHRPSKNVFPSFDDRILQPPGNTAITEVASLGIRKADRHIEIFPDITFLGSEDRKMFESEDGKIRVNIGRNIHMFKSEKDATRIVNISKLDAESTMALGNSIFGNLGIANMENGRSYIFAKGVGLLAHLLSPETTVENVFDRNKMPFPVYRNACFPEHATLSSLIYMRISDENAVEYINEKWLKKESNGGMLIIKR